MQIRRLARVLAATAAVVLVSLGLVGASWYTGTLAGHPASAVATPSTPMVGVPTGTYVDGIEVQRLPSITVTARRSDLGATR